MINLETADIFDERLKSINSAIETTLPHFRELMIALQPKTYQQKNS